MDIVRNSFAEGPMDIEDDAHITSQPKPKTIEVIIPDWVMDELVERILNRIDTERIVTDSIEYYMDTHFDINDYTHNLDMYDIKRGIVDDVIDTIKDRL